jgi:Fe-S-cluster containining protein
MKSGVRKPESGVKNGIGPAQGMRAVDVKKFLTLENIAFKCEICGECCRAEGFVYLKRGELEAMAAYNSKTAKEFRDLFTEFRLFKGRVIKQDSEGCVLLVDGRCAVYEARPSQCREFPFWKHVDEKWWEYFGNYCPGVRNAKIRKNL